MYILCINYSLNAYDMPIPRYIATLALMPKSALNKYWRYIEGTLYIQVLLKQICVNSEGIFSVIQMIVN